MWMSPVHWTDLASVLGGSLALCGSGCFSPVYSGLQSHQSLPVLVLLLTAFILRTECLLLLLLLATFLSGVGLASHVVSLCVLQISHRRSANFVQVRPISPCLSGRLGCLNCEFYTCYHACHVCHLHPHHHAQSCRS